MLPDGTNLTLTRKRSKLALSPHVLKKYGFCCNDNSSCMQSNQTLQLNQITNASRGAETDESLDDFKSPIKLDTKSPKNIKRRNVRPYRYPGDNTCTQDIIVDAYKKAREDDNEYRSEDEFVNLKNKEDKQMLGRSVSADKKTEKCDNKSKTSAEAKFAVPAEPLIVIEPTNKEDNKHNSNKHLRKEFQNMKISNVIIEDSEDEVIACSQKVVRANFLKTGQILKTKTLTGMKNENSDSKSLMRTSTFWNSNCEIKLLYSERQTEKGIVYDIPQQNCVPLPVLFSNKGTINIPEITNCKAVKDEIAKENNVSINLKNSNEVQVNNQFSIRESSMRRKLKVRKIIESSTSFLTPKKSKPKKLKYAYVRKLWWWTSKYYYWRRKYRLPVGGIIM